MANTQTKNQIDMILSSNTSKHKTKIINSSGSSNENIQEFIKSTFAKSNDTLNNKIEWIWSEEKEKDSRVNQLFSICDEQLNSLYECEMKYGSNSEKCVPILSNYNRCLEKRICPQDYYLKEIFCFGKTDLDNIIFPSSTLNQLNDEDKNGLCKEFTQELKSCINQSLSKIWS